jgi:hypothetical protein
MQAVGETLTRFWRRTLGQGEEAGNPLRIPFIDFARGDGLTIGPGSALEWTVELVDETTPWARAYRGLWGLYAQDPISGENAPAGPMHNRDGSPRASWFDPLGFAGLDQVPPPPDELEVLERECDKLESRQAMLEELLPAETRTLQELGTRLRAMEGSPHLAPQYERLERDRAQQAENVKRLRRERSENDAILEGLERRIASRREGRQEDARAHIQHAAEPVAPSTMRFNKVAEVWAALSISLLLVGLAAFVVYAPTDVWASVVILVLAFVVVESVLRGTFIRTMNRVAVVLALVAAVVLVVHWWKPAVVGLLLALAGFLVYQRLRELRA